MRVDEHKATNVENKTKHFFYLYAWYFVNIAVMKFFFLTCIFIPQ